MAGPALEERLRLRIRLTVPTLPICWSLPFSVIVVYLVPGAPAVVETALAGVATVGEVWMIVYLLIKGVRSDASVSTVSGARVAV